MRKLIGFIGISSLLLNCVAFAGDKQGNGGDALVCRDLNGGISKAMLLDHYEIEESSTLHIDLGPSAGTAYLEKVQTVLSRIQAFDSARAADLLSKLESFKTKTRFTENAALIPIQDFDIHKIELRLGCAAGESVALMQAAVQIANPEEFEPKFLIDGQIWKAMDEQSKAGLTLHELIYWEQLSSWPADTTTSNLTRLLNGFWSSDQMAAVKLQNEYFLKLAGAYKQIFSPVQTDTCPYVVSNMLNWGKGERLTLPYFFGGKFLGQGILSSYYSEGSCTPTDYEMLVKDAQILNLDGEEISLHQISVPSPYAQGGFFNPDGESIQVSRPKFSGLGIVAAHWYGKNIFCAATPNSDTFPEPAIFQINRDLKITDCGYENPISFERPQSLRLENSVIQATNVTTLISKSQVKMKSFTIQEPLLSGLKVTLNDSNSLVPRVLDFDSIQREIKVHIKGHLIKRRYGLRSVNMTLAIPLAESEVNPHGAVATIQATYQSKQGDQMVIDVH